MEELKCPKCSSDNVIEIIYGKMSGDAETVKKMAQGKVKLGGMCVVAGKSPQKRCNDCGYGWDDLGVNGCLIPEK